jgi:hypothetical protein
VTFNPTSPGAPPALTIGCGISDVACPSASQCTATRGGYEVTFNPAAQTQQAAVLIDNANAVLGIACPSATQCTAVDDAGNEVTFNPNSPGTPAVVTLHTQNAMFGIACPSTAQCTAVDAGGDEITFNPNSPGTPTPVTIDSGHVLHAIACPSSDDCVAVDGAGRAMEGDPTSSAAWALKPLPGANSLNSVACSLGGQCVAVDSVGNGFVGLVAPAISSVSPSSGPSVGGTSVTITGTNLTGATAVNFGGSAASNITVNSDTQITATSPAGAGTVDVAVTTPGGTSATNSADQFMYVPAPTVAAPTVVTGKPSVGGTQGATFSATVNPNGSPTFVHFEYGLDPKYTGQPLTYDQSTPTVLAGSDAAAHSVSQSVTGLVPNALYHVRLVAVNSVGTTVGPDQTFMTAKDPAPPPPVLGKSVNVLPVSGLVFIKLPKGKPAADASAAAAITKGAGFIPLTEPRRLPSGTQIDARRGTLTMLTAATTKNGKLGSVQFSGAIFGFAQAARGPAKGLTTISLLEGDFKGAPSYASCPRHAADWTPVANAAVSSRILQTLRARDKRGKFRTRGRYSAATVRGTVWDTVDRCDGTLTIVHRGTVLVGDFGRRKTITVHAGHRYLAKAFTAKHG